MEHEHDEDDCEDDGLTIKQRLFVQAITGPASSGNAVKAARLAGYTGDYHTLGVTGHDNLKKPKIQEAISHALARKRASPEWAKDSLTELAGSSMANFVSVDDRGVATLDFKKAAAAGAIGQIKKIKQRVIPAKDDEGEEVLETTVEIHDRLPALQTLMKLMGMIDQQPDADADAYVEADPQVASASPPPGAIPPVA